MQVYIIVCCMLKCVTKYYLRQEVALVVWSKEVTDARFESFERLNKSVHSMSICLYRVDVMFATIYE